MKLPEPAPQPQGANAVVANMSAHPSSYPSAQAGEVREVPSIFIGLGPEGRSVTVEELSGLLRSKARQAENIRDVRLRGRCAFADTTTVEEAHHLIAELDNYLLKDAIQLSVQMSKQTLAESKQRRREREEARAGARGEAAVNGGCQVFLNLGPKGEGITDDVIRAKIEAICPITKMERRGHCVYVDVNSPEDTQRVVAAINDCVVDDVRIIAMVSKGQRKRGRTAGSRRGGRSPRRDDRRSSRHARRRSGSRDGGRRHRRSRRSYTPSSRSSSSSYSRGRRSYSSDSADSRDYWRDRRHGRRGAPRRDDRRDDHRRGDRRDRR